MKICEILSAVRDAKGSNEKKRILTAHKDNDLLKKVLLYGSDPFTPFHIVKVPATAKRFECSTEEARWEAFFNVADMCSSREYTGNMAIEMMSDTFCVASEEEEKWMRKILKKHLSIGASTKTINKVFDRLIPTFDVSLAQKFEEKRILGMKEVCVEPKLDGIRCFAVVENDIALLFARSGKLISNFNSTIGSELLKLGEGCYDGELMGDDFTSIMRQAYRKSDIDTDGTYLAVFDYLPLDEWKSGTTVMSCHDRRENLLDKLCESTINFTIIQPVERVSVPATYKDIKKLHDEFVASGYEGAMIKDLDAPYKFGRGYEVMKLKAFHDVDLTIQKLLEGTGKHKGKMGSILVNYEGVDVQVGSGFSDDLREMMWNSPDDFLERVVEIRYQEVTPDGSLRFPTFVCFRNDR